MWNLIAKDLYLQRTRLPLLMLIGIMMLAYGGNAGVLMLIFVVTYGFTLSGCYHEDTNQSITFIRSLPVTDRVVVNSKFGAVIMLEAVVLMLIFVFKYLGIMVWIPGANSISMDFSIIALAVSLTLLLNSVMLLVYFRWGYSNIQLFYTISFIAVFLGGLKLAPHIAVFLSGIHPGQGAVLGTALVLMVVFLCWKGSVLALSKK